MTETEDHFICLASPAELRAPAYYVRRVVLIENEGQFAAKIVILPHGLEGKPATVENDAAIFFGGSFPGLQTGSRLNLLLLQGKLLRIEAGPRPPKDAPAGPNLYWVREIEALVGKEFEETLLREYRPSRSAE